MAVTPKPSEEEQELLDLWQQYARYPKLYRWLELYFDKKNQFALNTYLDKTESAFQAYNIPRENEQYAWEIGSKNASKCKVWAMRYYEIKGMTKEKVLDMIAALAYQGKPLALQILSSLTDVYQPKPSLAIQNNTQINNITQVTPEEKTELNRQFEAFIDDKYRNEVQSNMESAGAAVPE